MKITKKFLLENNACESGMKYVIKNGYIGLEPIPFIKKLILENKLQWANWLVVRVMNRNQKIMYAVYAAKQVIDIFEKKYPNDKRPRQAIEMAIKCIKNNTEKNRSNAAAADAAYAAAYAGAVMMKILNYGLKLLKK